jgi:putative ABC transport system substrate-binding protein
MRLCLPRREFIAGLGGAAAWPLAARAQQDTRVRRVGVLMGPFDENDPVWTPRLSAFTQALAGLGWTDGRNVRMDFGGAALTSFGYARSRRSWSSCNPISS